MAQNWRQSIHLEPKAGWLNDPNGLCFADGKYHVYFQFSPDSAKGSGRKCWGHFESSDKAASWDYTGIVMEPDIPEDRNGVYSGCAVVRDGRIYIFYTGNVKLSGDYDYIRSGREANQILVTSEDGRTVSAKKILLRNRDYPDYCSCHVRDPKVWIEDGIWKMVLGARTTDDRGCVLYYEAEDPYDWHYVKTLSVDGFGYMWECPDQFTVGDKVFLGVSPQGLAHEQFRYQNVYSSGYFKKNGDALSDFEEFDYGFDFYAPQTFTDENGDRILIGWMGIGDIPYSNPTTELGWQHCLTVPRRLSVGQDGFIRQEPVINSKLFGEAEEVNEGEVKEASLALEITSRFEDTFRIRIGDADISYNGNVLTLDLSSGDSGYGRKVRRAMTGRIEDIRIIADNSSLEVYAGDGRYVMSTRFYPSDPVVKIESEGAGFTIRPIEKMEVRGFE
ncbi:MAG: glycoside hydrolase family 32 protein [Clostridiales bacterium]|nr:glycoside hydrolase family 32 protein [Clostridiales bacterium]